jgi:hypothetical protein
MVLTLTYSWLFCFAFDTIPCISICKDNFTALQSLDRHAQGHLDYHVHKEVPFPWYLSQCTCWAVRLPMLAKLHFLGLCHQSNPRVAYFFSAQCNNNTFGTTRDNKLEAVEPRVSVWQFSCSIRKAKVMPTCL